MLKKLFPSSLFAHRAKALLNNSDKSSSESEESEELEESKAPETTRVANRSIRKQSARLTLDNILNQDEQFYTDLFANIITTLADENARVTIAEHLLITVAINYFTVATNGLTTAVNKYSIQPYQLKFIYALQSALTAAEIIEHNQKNDALTRLAHVTVTPNSDELRFLEKLCELFSTQHQDYAHLMRNICFLAFARIDAWITRCVRKSYQLRQLQHLVESNYELMTLYVVYANRHRNRFSESRLAHQDTTFLQPFENVFNASPSELEEQGVDRFSVIRDSIRTSATRSTIISEKDAKALDRGPLQSQYSTTLVTWNAGGKNPHKDTIEDLKNEIFSDGNDPDIIICSLQEARPSLNNNENIAERFLKRCKDDAGEELYQICHSSKVDVFIYHERYVATQPNYRETCLVIAYKKSSFPHGQIKVKISGESFATDDPGHKGGIYAILSVHEVNIGVIALHLDSKNLQTAKSQAENLVMACKSAEIPLDGIAIAGDFNTRLHPDHLPPDANSSPNSPIPAARIQRYSLSEETETPVQKFAKNSQHLEGFTFFELKETTYCKSDILSPNAGRGGHIDAGKLDNIGFVNMSATAVLTFPTAHPQDAKIARPQFKNFLGQSKELSDHAAVIGVLNLSCPARLRLSNYLRENTTIDNAHALNELHTFLECDNTYKIAVLRAYFDYAIAMKQPAFEGDSSFPYHLKEIALVKTDISFIVSHLSVLSGQSNEVAPYRDLIFGTCEAIEARSGNAGEFMQFIYTQLLDEEIRGVNQLKMALLNPFRQWLDNHGKERERYTFSGNESHFTVKKLGFFAGSAPQDLALTAFERAQLR